ncbi:DNA repair exonuclease [Tardiphaga sp.]|uniref:metallophosphoesterase family protein n=1 Tax=Tardiphaga sp. TaxID=1926292 RepID=UPI0025E090AA|nr:DNA repair exonuclease [Tardiphaga sp.]
MRFSFIHAADLHIDSPLAGLRLKDAAVAARFAEAGRRAVEALVAETIASKASFLIIAGDVFDGSWKDVTTGLFFVGAIGRLHREGIPTFIVKGNHDAESVVARDLPYPDSVRVFSASQASSIALESCRVVLHGRSFPNRHIDEFVATYPARHDGWLNIGVLHTSLDGRPGHAGYAPCSVDDLKRFGYDYWALGHIHAHEIVDRDPWIVFPGNLQGRGIRETGAKGAVRVTVEDGRIVEVAPIVLDGARWAHLTLDIARADAEDEVVARITAAIADAHAGAEGRPLAIRVTLTGATALHNHLVARREWLEEDLRARALRFGDDCWIEQLKVRTTSPPRPLAQLSSEDSLDLDQLLDATLADAEFAATLADLIETVRAKLPKDLQDDLVADNPQQTLADEARALLAGALS